MVEKLGCGSGAGSDCAARLRGSSIDRAGEWSGSWPARLALALALVLALVGCEFVGEVPGSDDPASADGAGDVARESGRSLADSGAAGAGGTIRLPEPTGSYSVASRRYRWIDASRLEGGSEDPTDHRVLHAQVYYPALPNLGESQDYVRGLASLEPWLDPATFETLKRVEGPVAAGGPMVTAEGEFPTVLFAHGWQSRSDHYTALLADIASYGYVVVAIDQPYQGRIVLSDGQVTEPSEDHFADPMAMVRYYGRDFGFVVQQLQRIDDEAPFDGKVDPSRVVAVGHSNGAVTALAAAAFGDGIAGVVSLDSWDPAFEQIFALPVPFLLLRTAAPEGPSLAYLAATGGVDVALDGLEHSSASDWPYLEARSVDERSTAEAALRQLREFVVYFLDGVFDSSRGPWLERVPESPGVTIRGGSNPPPTPSP